MAVYKCSVCGMIYDEEEQGKPLSELTECPLCKQPVSKFVLVSGEKEAEDPKPFEGNLNYDPALVRKDPSERYMGGADAFLDLN